VTGTELVLVDIYPALSMPQADGGNLRVLEARARARGIVARTIVVQPGDPLPSADLYQLAGAEDEDLPELARRLREDGALGRAVGAGAVLLAIDVGLQVAGERFAVPDGTTHPGLGLLDVRSSLGGFVEGPALGTADPGLGLPDLVGYESHAGRTELGPGLRPLATLQAGTGNGGTPATDGALDGRIVATYLHGPLLAWNPGLADHLLALAIGGDLPPMPTSDPAFLDAVRAARSAQARAAAGATGAGRSR
jgi:CobQ-like glutamine amidotransferase family enzyme